MPGPPPKDPALRARRNTVAGAGVLEDNRQGARVPPLPKRRGEDGRPLDRKDPRNWLPETRAWWRDVWRSAMAARFLQVEVHGLAVIAQLREEFWRAPSSQVAAEIRLQEARWGLDQLARWRLQWQVVGDLGEDGQRPPAPPPLTAPDPAGPPDDPSNVLRALFPPAKKATA